MAASRVVTPRSSGSRGRRRAALLKEAGAALQEHLALSPAPPARFRVAVVADADELSVQAANRLLKTLEEPPPRARILLSTSREGAMLPTVLSRCVRWRVAPPDPAAGVGPGWRSGSPPPGRRRRPRRSSPACSGAPGSRRGRPCASPGWKRVDRGRDLAPPLAARSPAAQVAAAERARAAGWGAAARAAGAAGDGAESMLPEAWRRRAPSPCAAQLRERRELLRQARAATRGGNVPLNAQLAFEALAFAGR